MIVVALLVTYLDAYCSIPYARVFYTFVMSKEVFMRRNLALYLNRKVAFSLCLCFGLFAFAIANVNAQDCQKLTGTWVNELGSALVIESIAEDGQIIGEYRSSTGVDGKVFPLMGWVNAKTELPEEKNMAFSVRWEGYGSITSWTGYCNNDEGIAKIKTLWHLVRSEKEFDWERIITNSSTFVAEEAVDP